MLNLITGVLDAIAAAVGKLGPLGKAAAPAGLALAVAIENSIATGKVDSTSITIAATGLVSALLSYLVPNKTAAAK